MNVIEGEGRIAHVTNSRLAPERLPATILTTSSGVISVRHALRVNRD
jgi:hypothetical protein